MHFLSFRAAMNLTTRIDSKKVKKTSNLRKTLMIKPKLEMNG